IGMDLERTVSRVPNTRSVYSDRSTGGFYLDIVPNREALARYGLTVGEVQDVIEAAVGGQPIEVTVEGRNRFTINVRYPRGLRRDVGPLRPVLGPPRMGARGAGAPAMGGGMGAIPEAAPVLVAAAGVSDAGDAYLAQRMGGSPRQPAGAMGEPPGAMSGSRGAREGAGQGDPLPFPRAPAAPGR